MLNNYINPASTVDLIVSCSQGIVLVKRKNNPYKNYWAIPGGFIDLGKETLEQAASRELFEETNLRVNVEDLKLFNVYSDPNRDPRGHVISHVYEVMNFSGQLKAKDDALEVRIFRKLPNELAFDHMKILNDYFKKRKIGDMI